MTAATAVRARLLQISAVTALVNSRVHVLKRPENPVFPCVLVQQIDDPEFSHLRGGVSFYRTRVQVDAAAMEMSGSDPYAGAASIDTAIKGPGDATALGYWHGSIGSPALEITGILPQQMREGYDTDVPRCVVFSRDYFVFHRG